MKFALVAFIVFLCLASVAAAYPSSVYGVDVSQYTSESAFKCLYQNGLTFAVVRGFRSTGSPDPNARATVSNAHAAGIPYVDIYLFPCPHCGDPGSQVRAAVNNMNGVSFGMLWLDIEGTQYWNSDKSANQQFFEGLVDAASSMGVSLGVYTSEYQWGPIMGSSYTGGASYPLWYAHYDGQPSFGDFSPFGGWSHPAIKQFSDQGSKCGASYDINWYPPGNSE